MTDIPSPTTPDSAAPRPLRVRGEIVDLVIGSCLAALAIAFWIGAASFDESDGTGVTAATFPRGIAVLLGATTAILIARAVAGLLGYGTQEQLVTERPLYVLAGMAAVVAFPVLMTTIGFYIATALWMPALFLIGGYRKPLGIVIYTAAFLAFAKVVFEMTLGVRLS